MVSTAKQGHQQLYSNTENSTGKGSRDGWKILQSKKADSPTPWGSRDCHTRDPPCWVSLFHYIMSVTAPTPISGRTNPEPWCAPMLCTSPLFLVCLTDHFWVSFASFPLAIQILQKTLQQSCSTDPGTTPLCLCAAPDFGQRGCKYVSKSNILIFLLKNTWFFLKSFITDFLKNFLRALGCLKSTFLIKVMW